MDEQSDSVANEAAQASVEPPPLSVGVMLREARLHSGMSVGEVSSRIKFATRQIEALEADDFGHLPEMAFVRGFVRSYARLLHLDEELLLSSLPQALSRPVSEEVSVLAEVPTLKAYSVRKPNILWLAAGLGVTVVLSLFVWLHDNEPEANQERPTRVDALELPAAVLVEPKTTSAPPVQTLIPAPAPAPVVIPPAAAPTAAPVNTPAKPLPADPEISFKDAAPTEVGALSAGLHFAFDMESWVEVHDANGKTLLAQLNAAGTVQNVRGTPPFTLLVGNSGGVHLSYKGKTVDLAPHSNAQVAHLTLE